MRLASLVRWSARGAAALLLMTLVASPPANADGNKGKYAEWTAEWWQWVYSLPVSENPLFDETGEKAYNAQPNKKVFFLVGVANESNTVSRNITIKEGTPLFGPLINFENDNVSNDTPLKVPELRAQATALIDLIDPTKDIYLMVDGDSRLDLVDRIASPVFSYVLPDEDNIYGGSVTGRIKPALSDGYWFYIPPLAVGEHTIRFGGGLDLDDNGELDFVLDITYHVTVVAAKKR